MSVTLRLAWLGGPSAEEVIRKVLEALRGTGVRVKSIKSVSVPVRMTESPQPRVRTRRRRALKTRPGAEK